LRERIQGCEHRAPTTRKATAEAARSKAAVAALTELLAL
jgi:hypothetical protein